jgi:hypothetical protein
LNPHPSRMMTILGYDIACPALQNPSKNWAPPFEFWHIKYHYILWRWRWTFLKWFTSANLKGTKSVSVSVVTVATILPDQVWPFPLSLSEGSLIIHPQKTQNSGCIVESAIHFQCQMDSNLSGQKSRLYFELRLVPFFHSLGAYSMFH